MEGNGGVIAEIRAEIRELKEFNREQKEINREQKEINKGLTRLFMQSEKRFQTFYRLIVDLQHRRG